VAIHKDYLKDGIKRTESSGNAFVVELKRLYSCLHFKRMQMEILYTECESFQIFDMATDSNFEGHQHTLGTLQSETHEEVCNSGYYVTRNYCSCRAG
jgi:hypothetical protein